MKFQLTTILALALTSTAIANFVPVARSNNGIAARSMKHGKRRDEIPVEGEIAETDELETDWDESWEEEFAAAEAEAEAEAEEEEEVARREDVGFPIEGAEAAEVAGEEGEGEKPEVEDEGEDEDEEKGEREGVEEEGETGWWGV